MTKYNKWSKITSLSLAAATVTIPHIVQAEDNPFSDIQEGDSTYESVTTLAQEGIINGYPDGTYRPSVTLNKKQAAILFSKSLKLQASEDLDKEDFLFEQVNPESREAPYVYSLYKQDILKNPESFDPNEDLTREEMAQWLMRTFDLKALDNTQTVIPDFSEVNEDYQQAVVSLYHNDITKGMKDGSFAPKETVNRGQFAIFLYRALNNQPIDRVQKYDDIYTQKNVTPMLPDTANVLLEDGTLIEKNVSWQNTNLDLAKEGSYNVEGLVQGTLEHVNLTVHVGKKQVEDVTGFDDVTTIVGKPPQLPENVQVTYDDGTEESLAVDWEQVNIDSPGDYLVKGNVEGIQQEISLNVHAVKPELKVEQVTSQNLREIDVQFNFTPKNMKNLLDSSFYQVSDHNGQDVEIDSLTFNEETNTLNIVSEFPLTKGEGNVTIGDSVLEESYQASVEFKDEEAPQVSSVKAVGPRQVELHFSEPVNLPTNDEGMVTDSKYKKAFTINDAFTHVHQIEQVDYGKTYLVTFASEFYEGENTLSVSDKIQDYDYKGVSDENNEEEFIYENLSSFTDMTDIHVDNPYQVTLGFKHPVQLLDEEGFKLLKGEESIKPQNIKFLSSRELTLTFEERIENQDELIIEDETLRDNWKNENKEQSFSLSIEEDETAPSIDQVRLVEEQDATSSNVQFKIVLNEPIKVDDKQSMKIVNQAGETFEVQQVQAVEDNRSALIATIDVPYGELREDQYTLLTSSLTDLYGNQSDQVAFDFHAKSLDAPGNFSGHIYSQMNELIFTVNFNQEMTQSGEQSITDLSQYELHFENESLLLSDLANKPGIQINLDTNDAGDQSKIYVKYSPDKATHSWMDTLTNIKDSINEDEIDTLKLNVGKVASEAGASTKSFYNPVDLSLQQPFTLSQATAVDENTLKATLNQKIEYYNEEDIIVFTDDNHNDEYDRGEELPFSSSYEVSDDQTTLTIDMDNEDFVAEEDEVYITTSYNTFSKDTYGQELEIQPYLVEDGIPAQLIEDEIAMSETDEGNALVSLPFTDEIDGSTLSRLTFSLEEGNTSITNVQVEKKQIFLTISSSVDISELTGAIIEQAFPIIDEKGNTIQDLSFTIPEID